jgi:uncharacterized Ntn-hydrolase superfamily protein
MTTVPRRAILAAALAFPAFPASASATWSIIVLDRKTGLVGVAAASCVSDVHGIMALFPGKGALVAQAMVHGPAMGEAIRLLRAGVAPDSVLRVITSPTVDSATQDRQYGMATFTGGQVQYTGSALRQHRGERSADGILVQGGLLTSTAVLDRALEAVQQARLAGRPLEDLLMAGLKAGADAGGDSRCGDRRASAAFLAMARPGAVPNWPYLTLRVVDAGPAAINAVELLETRLALWKSSGQRFAITSETVKPDSAAKR